MKRRMIADLERRAAAMSTPEDPVTALDVVAEWVAGGGYIRDLARDIAKVTKQPCSFSILSSWANHTAEGKQKLAAARMIQADYLVEEGQEILDELDGEPSKERIAAAKARAEYRQWRASKYDRAKYGADVAQVNVAVSLPGQHLEALRLRAVEAKTPPTLPPAGEDYEVVVGD